jgi:hypothetical protein
MTHSQLPGSYTITGTNQDEQATPYKGTIELALDHHNRIIAKWHIGASQTQSGTGFFKDNVLVINFNYKGDDGETYEGVVVYKCITKDVLEGFWSEQQANPLYLGSELCFRVDSQIEAVN